MRELTLEEKARAYDEALERAKKVNRCEADDREPGTSICEYIFPEIHEPEDKDEMIRKCLINGMSFYLERWENSTWGTEKYNMKVKDILEWLKKQDKGKFVSSNKHDWSKEDEYRLEILNALCEDKLFESVPNSTMYEEMKITIDWLNSIRPRPKQEWSEEDERIILAISQLLKDCESENGWNCVYSNDREVFFADIKNYLQSFKNRITPQSKQEWSKEDDNCLSTIIAEFSKCAGKSVSRDEWMRCNDFLNSLKNRVLPQTKQEWKEEDIHNIENIDSVLFYDKDLPEATRMRLRNWLKYLKPQSKQEWSEDDDDFFNDTIAFLKNTKNALDHVDWIKSLKERCTWKPSEEQMNALWDKISNDNLPNSEKEISQQVALTELYEQLKKLKEL